MEQRQKKALERYRKQELMIAHNLNLDHHPDFIKLDERVQRAQEIEELETVLRRETIMLFAPDPEGEKLSPLTIDAYCSKLLQDCRALCEMAVVRAPVWTYDRIAACLLPIPLLSRTLSWCSRLSLMLRRARTWRPSPISSTAKCLRLSAPYKTSTASKLRPVLKPKLKPALKLMLKPKLKPALKLMLKPQA